MFSRDLLHLAMSGYRFPRPNALRNVCEVPLRPQSFPAVRVRVIKPFYGLRRLLEAGEVVDLIEPDATSAVALGRAERL